MANERLEEIRKGRLKKRADLIADGVAPYPAEVKRTHTAQEALDDFDNLTKEETPITLAGRLTAVREHGSVIFWDLTDATGKIQLQLSREDVPKEIFAKAGEADTGDFIEAAGKLITTQRGMPTLLVAEWHMLSKSIRPLPSDWYGFKDKESRYRIRAVDFLMNDEARSVIVTRSKVIDWLREQMKQEGFLDVETPILQPMAGGATAAPFVTHHETLDEDLYLRIAPELYLKRLLVGGFEKVFEVGRNFRNEGIDREHNPEFTMLEYYWAYADYEDLMDFTEKLLTNLVRAINGNEDVKRGGETVSFAQPWKRLRYVDAVSDKIGIDILAEKDTTIYEDKFKELGLELPAVRTYAKLVDELFKELIRPTLINPTIVYDYPYELVPLAKQNLTDPRIVEMFQLVVYGAEVVKAYTELNDPVVQKERFEAQQEAREAGDKEIAQVDDNYIETMEYGMPPAAGCGIGIDRLVWLITGAPTVRDTIAFPILRTKE
ncbi:MAG: lysine--tRNA ligase [bacterium]|nr:lysine--tRNA ligase [bacterium]MDZ4345232.1 lysine--tRNA ligase [Candidatus Binatia bacterium]